MARILKNAMYLLAILAVCLGGGTIVAQPPENVEATGKNQVVEENPTFFYKFAQFLVHEPDKSFTKPTMKDPGPDTANFPNGPYTLPKGMFYLEVTPFNLTGASVQVPRTFSTPTLVRYGITDDVEFRLFSNGLTAINEPATSGFSPLVFDIKIHFWDEPKDSIMPAMGLEVALETSFGSKAFSTGLQPSFSLLFSKELPWDLLLEANVGLQSGDIGNVGFGDGYELNVQGAFTKKVTEKCSVFIQTFYNGATNPRFANNTTLGAGATYNLTETITIWGSYNAGLVNELAPYLAYSGVAFAF